MRPERKNSEGGCGDAQLLRREVRAAAALLDSVVALLTGLGSSVSSRSSSALKREGLVVRLRVDRLKLAETGVVPDGPPPLVWSSFRLELRVDCRAGVCTWPPCPFAPAAEGPVDALRVCRPVVRGLTFGRLGSAPIDESDDEPPKTSSGAGVAEGEGECLRLRLPDAVAGEAAVGIGRASRVAIGG